jgi:hypothetical protein
LRGVRIVSIGMRFGLDSIVFYASEKTEHHYPVIAKAWRSTVSHNPSVNMKLNEKEKFEARLSTSRGLKKWVEKQQETKEKKKPTTTANIPQFGDPGL